MLVNTAGDDGDNNPPCVNAAATCHTDNVATTAGHRRPIAVAAACTATTASATGEAAGPAGTLPGSTRTANAVNAARTGSARETNRRSQPRTVAAGRPSAFAIPRCPPPAALASRPAPITATTSARRANATNGSNTCVRPQPPHRARRGRTRTRPATPRSQRARPNPHGHNTPVQTGQRIPPERSLTSTLSASVSTVSIKLPPCSAHGPPGDSAKRRPAGPYLIPDPLTLSSHTKKGKPHGPPSRSCSSPLTLTYPTASRRESFNTRRSQPIPSVPPSSVSLSGVLLSVASWRVNTGPIVLASSSGTAGRMLAK